MQKFVECRYRDKKAAEAWYRECEKNGWPYIVVYPRQKYARVQWDNLCMAQDAERRFRDRATEVIDCIQGVFSQFAPDNRDMIGIIGALTGYIDHLPIEDARQLAGELHGIFVQAMKDKAAALY